MRRVGKLGKLYLEFVEMQTNSTNLAELSCFGRYVKPWVPRLSRED